MGDRRHGREIALQALYLSDTCGIPLEKAYQDVTAEPLPAPVREFSRHLIEGFLAQKEHIDVLLAQYTKNWELKRMASVDRNILRLSALEILTDINTPVSVIIDEAIEIAKTYSTSDSGKFVNGVLDKVKLERKIP